MHINDSVDTLQDLTNSLLPGTEGLFHVKETDRIYKWAKEKREWIAIKFKSMYFKQDKNYKNCNKKIRNVNLVIDAPVEKIKNDFFNNIVTMLNKTCETLFKMCKNGDFGDFEETKQILNNKSFVENICKSKKQKNGLGFKNFYRNLGFKDYKFINKKGKQVIEKVEKMSIPKRGFLRWAQERILAILERFPNLKQFKRPKKIEDCARLYNSQVKIKNGIIKIMPFYKQEYYEYPLKVFRKNDRAVTADHEENIFNLLNKKESQGGNLKFSEKQNAFTFTQRLTFESNWKYEPKGFLGFDINKSPESFLFFSKTIEFNGKKTKVIKKNKLDKKIQSLEYQLKDLNSEKGLRKKAKKVHKKLRQLYKSAVLEILNYCEKNELAICIDDLTTGERNGSFGQDKIRSLMVEICEQELIPFVLVPTPYTTRICNSCGHVHPKIDTEIRKFNCQKCNKFLIRDENSAKNIETIGKEIWENGFCLTLIKYKKEFGVDILKHK
jgi:hypothetical protein